MESATSIAYRRPAARAGVDLRLDANEGPDPDRRLRALVSGIDSSRLRRYPDSTSLESAIAGRLGLPAERVLVTAGADDGIDRCCRLALAGGGNLILPRPGFEMFARYAALAGVPVRDVDWASGNLPVRQIEERADEGTRAIAVISPNNPTGLTASAADVLRLAERLPSALVIVDRAYAEYSDDDLDTIVDAPENVVTLRTFSKAWGLAGLRVGYLTGRAEVVERLRACGPPYAVSGLSLALAESALELGEATMRAGVERVRTERVALATELTALGADPTPSQANFVLARFADAARVWEDLQALGIAVRRWPNDPALADCLRITCPGNAEDFERLTAALRTCLRPQAVLFDMDGVLADEGPSYREAIVGTAASFGVAVDRERIGEFKARGGANNDWEVTRRILEDAGVDVPFEQVKTRFEELYQGAGDAPGLWERETCLVDRALLERIARRHRLGIVTGRPRRDAERFLRRFGLREFFGTVVTLDDAPPKPDPAPVLRALAELEATAAWMIGDTPDDARAARAAGVLPVGVLPPSTVDAVSAVDLLEAGCTRVLPRLDSLEEMLP